MPGESIVPTNNLTAVTSNIRTLTKHADKTSYFAFRVVTVYKKGDDQPQYLIKTNNIFLRIINFLFRAESQKELLNKVISSDRQILTNVNRSDYIHAQTQEMTEIFHAVHSYNQVVQNSSNDRLKKAVPLISELGLTTIENATVPELKPLTVEISDPVFIGDASEEFKLAEKIGGKFKYEGHHEKHHGLEAVRIFFSTQVERVKSGIGTAITKCAGLFGKEVHPFKNAHYFRHQEDKHPEQIYSQDSPLVQSEHPQSYWLGHASCMLSVPLESTTNPFAKTNINIITDPVEGDLNAILYPRKTKVARKIEECPALHVFLLSHNHLDHYDQATIDKLLVHQPVMLVPLGDAKLFRDRGFMNVQEMNWWEKTPLTFNQDGNSYKMDITFVPAKHWSGQGCTGFGSSFGGYVISGSPQGDILFRGDSARLKQQHVDTLRERFNIVCNFEPGGPDEMRKDMESTHQASVDGLWMHFNLMLKKLYKQHSNDKAAFLEACRQRKTVYMHTMTYKLGNLHFADTKESIQRVIDCLAATTEVKKYRSLKEYQAMKAHPYEQEVYQELLDFAEEMKFDGQSLTPQEVAEILGNDVIIPKIGSRTQLTKSK